MTRCRAVLAFAAFLLIIAGTPAAEPEVLKLPIRKIAEVTKFKTVTNPGAKEKKQVLTSEMAPVFTTYEVDPKKCAVVVCDMWDDHWCKSASKRCGELAKRTEPVLKACRDRGMTIIHCPSDTMSFYKDHPARTRALEAKKATPPKAKELPNPPLPVDDSDGGCDDAKPAKSFKAWTRQHAGITIDDAKDYITDSGAEVYNVLKEKGLDTVLVLGVHTNMCVLNRTFAIKQLVKWDVRTVLVRDLTDAMYNPKMKPFVEHDKGTQLIIAFIEQHWCPTVESKALLGK